MECRAPIGKKTANCPGYYGAADAKCQYCKKICLNPVPVARCEGPTASFRTRCTYCQLDGGCQSLTEKDVNCPGPLGLPPAARCPVCRSTRNLRERRNSISNLAGLPATTGASLTAAWSRRADIIMQQLFLEANGGHDFGFEYAMCVAGSGARNEACPYSDYDCFILLKDENEGNRQTALAASKWVETRLVSMESNVGLRLCGGGMSPTGSNAWKELIDTPANMAQVLEWPSQVNGQDYDHIKGGLTECRVGWGSGKANEIFLEFRNEIQRIMGSTPLTKSMRPKLEIRKRKALQDLKAMVNDPELTPPKWADGRFHIKKHFYRPPQFVAKALAWYYNIDEVETRSQIESLVAAEHLSLDNAHKLFELLDLVAKIRVKGHMGSKSERDHVRSPAYVASNADGNPNQEYELTAQEARMLEAQLPTVRRLHSFAASFVQQKEKPFFKGKRRNPFLSEKL